MGLECQKGIPLTKNGVYLQKSSTYSPPKSDLPKMGFASRIHKLKFMISLLVVKKVKKVFQIFQIKNISSHCVLCPAPTTFFALLLTPECLASLDSLALHELKQTRKQFVSCLSLFHSFFTPHNYREHFLSERLCSNYWIIVITQAWIMYF